MTDEHIRISWNVEHGRDIISIPFNAATFLLDDGSMRMSMDREWLKTLYRMLGEWVTVTSYVDNPLSVEDVDNPCTHEDIWLERVVCPNPCGNMHNYCRTCAKRMEPCPMADGLFGDLVYDGQDMNEMCHCGHAAMVHTSGSGNCLALGETAQEDSHCLEFFSPPETCMDCGHATIHGVGTPGVFPQFCETKKCNCTGSENLCDECPHSFWQHQQGDGGCPHCDCRVGDKVKPPTITLCDECHGEVYTFPRDIVQLGQRKYIGPSTAFTYKDTDGDEMMVYPYRKEVIVAIEGVDGMVAVRIPLGTLEAVIDAIRESGHRAVISGNK